MECLKASTNEVLWATVTAFTKWPCSEPSVLLSLTGASCFSSVDFWFSAVCTSHTIIGFCFMKWWVAFSFVYVCRILLAFLFLPYWHSIPCCHPHCCLFGFWCALTVRVPPGSSHAYPLDYLRLSFSTCACTSSILSAIQTEVTERPLTHQR